MKNFHILQHVPFEGPGSIFDWIHKKGYTSTFTHLFADEQPFPELNSFDALVVMGGPMGIYDDEEFPWLKEERQFIKKCIEREKPILGICLGAQFLADALGAKVRPNEVTEIGWFRVSKNLNLKDISVFKSASKDLQVMHWHGDTFEIPKGCERVYSSEYCKNQAFVSESGKWIGLQYHLELTAEGIDSLLKHSYPENKGPASIQSENKIGEGKSHISACKNELAKILSHWETLF